MLDKEFGAIYLVTGKLLNFNHGSTSMSLEAERTGSPLAGSLNPVTQTLLLGSN